MWARLGRNETDVRTLLHVWKERCYELPGLDEPRWIIDAGANVGYATRWFAESFPDATVIAIEPDLGNIRVLRMNVEHLSNVIVVQAALRPTTGTARLVDVGAGSWGFRVEDAAATEGCVMGDVPCVSIDSLIADYAIEQIDLLKVDIEGGELDLFEASGTWIGQVTAIAVELHDRFRPGCMRAFVRATEGFDREFARGENVFVLRTASSG